MMSGIIDDEENEMEEVKKVKGHRHLGIRGRHPISTIHRSRLVREYHDEVMGACKKGGGD